MVSKNIISDIFMSTKKGDQEASKVITEAKSRILYVLHKIEKHIKNDCYDDALIGLTSVLSFMTFFSCSVKGAQESMDTYKDFIIELYSIMLTAIQEEVRASEETKH